MNNNQFVPTKASGCYLDYTYCSSPTCNNECGRKMSDEIKEAIQNDPYVRYSVGNFCGEKNECK